MSEWPSLSHNQHSWWFYIISVDLEATHTKKYSQRVKRMQQVCSFIEPVQCGIILYILTNYKQFDWLNYIKNSMVSLEQVSQQIVVRKE